VYLHDEVELHVFIIFPSKSISIFLIPLESEADVLILTDFEILALLIGEVIEIVGAVVSVVVIGVGVAVGLLVEFGS
jgi:hypothetical protein